MCDITEVKQVFHIANAENKLWSQSQNCSWNPPFRSLIKLPFGLLSIFSDFKGYVSNENVQRYYTKEQVDLFINLSSSEGIPLAIMEAIAYGIPVVATDVGGVSEIIDNKNGLLISTDAQPEDIKKELEAFIKTYKQNAEEMRNSAYRFWQKKFNAKKNYDTFFTNL